MSEELKALFESGKTQEVLDRFTQKENTGEWVNLQEEEQIACIYYKCRSLQWLGRYEEALQTATLARTTYPSPKNPSFLLALLAAQYYVFETLRVQRLDEAQMVLAEGEGILKTLSDEERQTGALWIAVFEYVKGRGYYAKKELENTLEYHHKALKSFEAINNHHGTAENLCFIGHTYFFKGEQNTALEYAQRSLTLYESLTNQAGIAQCLNVLGLVYFAKGELDTALEYYQRSLSSAEASGNPLSIFYALTHSGSIYSIKGDLDSALDNLRRGLAIVEPLGLDGEIAYISCFMGDAYHQKRELDLALPFFQRSLARWEAVKNDYEIVRVLYHLVLLSLDQQEVEQAQKYLTPLQKVATRIPDEAKSAHLRSRLAEALVLKQSPRLAEKIRAQALLKQIVDEVTLLGFALRAMVALCDLLLLELKATGEEGVWEEAKALIHQFHTKAQDKQAFPMVVNALLLRAKFATIDGELDQAQKYFTEARMIVNEKNLGTLVKKVETEQKEFEAEFQRSQNLIQQHPSLQERIINAKLEEYMQEAQKEVNRLRVID